MKFYVWSSLSGTLIATACLCAVVDNPLAGLFAAVAATACAVLAIVTLKRN